MNSKRRIIGVIPAAGRGERIGPLPGSKELFPIGFGETMADGKLRQYPKVISQYLIDQMIRSGVEQIYLIISHGKNDLIQYYGSGQRSGVSIAYLIVEQMWGMPFSIDQSYSWVKEATVVFGMPDTIFTPSNALLLLLEHHQDSKADLTLGLYPTKESWRFGMVEFDGDNRATHCIDKPANSSLKNMWGNACWEPAFSELLHNEIRALGQSPEKEIVLGDYFQKAIDVGMNVRVVPFSHGEYLDIGTPQDLETIVRKFSQQSK